MSKQAKLRLSFYAPVPRIEAMDGATPDSPKVHRFKMVAYTGGKMDLRGWPIPVVVDLAGLKVPTKPRPVLKDHSLAMVVGHTESIMAIGKELHVNGLISGAGAATQEIVQSSLNGFPWQASIGADPVKIERVSAGAKAQANGMDFDGPVAIVRKSVLEEISFVALGADDNTEGRVAANRIGDISMKKYEKWLEAKGFKADDLDEAQAVSLQAMYDGEVKAAKDAEEAAEKAKVEAAKKTAPVTEPPPDLVMAIRATTAAEYQRIAAIRTACGEKHEEILAQAIVEGWDATKAELECLRADRPKVTGARGTSSGTVTADVKEAAICAALGLANLDKAFPEPVLEAAHRTYRDRISLQELLIQAANERGWEGRSIRSPGSLKSCLQAAFSTNDIDGILSNIANKFLLQSFNMVESTWRRVCAIRPVNNFLTVTSYRLTGDLEYKQVGPTGELTHGTLGEESFTNKADTYGRMEAITRTDIINDNLGALQSVPSALGRGGALKINRVFWLEFLRLVTTFYHTGHKNVSSGAGSALASAGLQAAALLFNQQTDADGNPLGIEPRILLVPPDLEVTGAELMQSTGVNTGGSSSTAKVPNKNVWAGKFRLEMSRYLNNSAITGHSAAHWFLLADPADLAVIEVAFLNGREAPIIESADADFNTLGIQMRGYHDFGVAQQDYRASVRSIGS